MTKRENVNFPQSTTQMKLESSTGTAFIKTQVISPRVILVSIQDLQILELTQA